MKLLSTIILLLMISINLSHTSETYINPQKSLTGIYFDSSKVRSSLQHSSDKTVKNDTIYKPSKIKKVNIDQTAEIMTIGISIPDDKYDFQIACYNMLGKKVLDVISGKKVANQREFRLDISKIPNGIYICVLQVSNGQKDTEKFIISR